MNWSILDYPRAKYNIKYCIVILLVLFKVVRNKIIQQRSEEILSRFERNQGEDTTAKWTKI